MAISDEQRAARAGRLGSSDSPRIMAGRWLEVWREKTGRSEPPNLDFVPVVQIGIATEPLHARFYAEKTGIACVPGGERTLVHPLDDFIVAHLDFLTWTEPGLDAPGSADTILEAKFHSGLKSDEELAEQYYWQLQHQMLVANLPGAVLSVLRPNSYSFIRVRRDDGDINTLVETLRSFWWHVENDVEPSDPLPVEPPVFDQLKVLDMSGHNEFMAFGGILLDHRSTMLAYREAETALKALMPEQAQLAFLSADGNGGGPGLFIARSRDGKLSLRFGAPPRKYLSRAESWSPDVRFDAAE